MTAALNRRGMGWRPLALLVFTSLAIVYVGSYYYLSRRGMREAKAHDIDGFLYIPCDEAFITKDFTRHNRLDSFYAPLNWIDRRLFGGTEPGWAVTIF